MTMIGIGQDARRTIPPRTTNNTIRAKTAAILSFLSTEISADISAGDAFAINIFKELPGPDGPHLVWASCKEAGIQQLEVLRW
jgi:hypothetical protein